MSKNTNLSFLTDYITADITNGRIGINTPSPTVAFDVTGVAKFSSSVSATSYNATTQNIFSVDGNEKMRITSGGFVGIGVTPNANWNTTWKVLQIGNTGSVHYTGVDYNATRLANGAYYSTSDTWNYLATSVNPSMINLQADGNLIFYNAVSGTAGGTFSWNERMRITSAGNVGIGTTSPSQKLEVIGTTKLSSAAGNVTGINIIPSSQTNIYQTIGETTNGPSGTVRFHAGIVTGWAAWENWGASYMDFKVEIKGSGTSDTSYTAMQIRPTGDIRMSSLVGSGSRAVMADANGQLSASVSDMTLKENITPIGYGLNEIMQMNPIWFEFKDAFKNYGETRQNGNIAQEMAEIIPEAVFTTPQTGKMGINYEQLHAVYIKAIQELKAEIETLKNK
jgi:hypothetical protein